MRTKEQIMEAVKLHHNYVIDKMSNATVIMTVLIGSQNYGIAHENSDIDTYSFVLPSIQNLACNADLIDTEYMMEDGKCCIKDIREALRLLTKTNPNSVEWFCSNYVVYNPAFKKILEKYFCENNRNNLLYCDVHRMGTACKGMSLQLKNRNMPIGNKYSHALRILSMWKHYTAGETDEILNFTDNETRREAFAAKIGGLGISAEETQEKIDKIADEIVQLVNEYKETYSPSVEIECKKEVREIQKHLFMRHITLELAKCFE